MNISMIKNISLFAFAVAFAALPNLTQAATYAYVNQSGNIGTVSANNSSLAIATAINIHMHSGVMLLNTSGDYNIVGGSVMGI